MTLLYLHLTALCMISGWIIGATIADPSYVADGLRGVWAAWVDLFRQVRKLLSHVGIAR